MEFKITGTGRLMKFRDDDKEVVIPSTVKSISAYAFSERYCLERIVIPDSVKLIEAFAFANCTSLKEVVMGNGVQTIKEKAFVGCKSLERIALSESLVEMESYVFSECESLKEVTFGSKLKSIVTGTFLGCKNLSLDVPKTIAQIASGAVSGIKNINAPHLSGLEIEQDCIIAGDEVIGCINTNKDTVIVPESVTKVGNGAFEANQQIIKIVLPNGVTSLGDFAFAFSEKLKELNIPKAVTQIGYSAFSGCSGVVPIYEGTSEEFAKISIKTNNQILKKRIKFAKAESKESIGEKTNLLDSVLGSEYKKDIKKYSYITQRLRLMEMDSRLYDLMKVGLYLDPEKIIKVAKISDTKKALLKNIREIKVVEIKKYPSSKNAYPKVFVDVVFECDKTLLEFECLKGIGDFEGQIFVLRSDSLWDIKGLAPICKGQVEMPTIFKIKQEESDKFGGVEKFIEKIRLGFWYDDNIKGHSLGEYIVGFEDVVLSNINIDEINNFYFISADIDAKFDMTIEHEYVFGDDAKIEPRECSSKIEYK